MLQFLSVIKQLFLYIYKWLTLHDNYSQEAAWGPLVFHMFQAGYLPRACLVKGLRTFKTHRSTYFPGMKIDPKYAVFFPP